MSNRPVLLLDVNYLCYRAFFSTGDLEFGDVGTGVLYGVFRDIVTFQEEHQTDRMVFCFDSKVNVRKDVYPDYKGNRWENESEEQAEARQELYRQINKLRRKYLPDLGYKNVFVQKGREADDLIARIAKDVNRDEPATEVIIISADRDLLQCLNSTTHMWRPVTRDYYTARHLWLEFAVKPWQWHLVKAIAGDGGDNLPGVKGVGEKTAAKFVVNSLNPTSKKYLDIVADATSEQRVRNIRLMQLPWPKTKSQRLRKDKCLSNVWKRVMIELGITTIDPPRAR